MTSATASQARVDEEITKYMVEVYALRTQRNAFSLVGRLPPETLANIFVHCASDHFSRYRGNSTGRPPSWVNVSYVCRHWRDVALNCPTLWTFPFISSPRWTEELLARSKQALLRVHLVSPRVTHRRVLDFMEQVSNHLERVQEFRLLMKYDVDKVLSQLSSRAPCLRDLEISILSGSSEWSSVLFDGDTPVLRTLELTRCPIPWYSFRLNGLTTLSLQQVPDRLQQNVGEFLANLRCMQDLTHLYLNRALSSAANFLSSAESHAFQKIDLPHLSRLLIAAPLSTVITLLSCMDFPLEAELRLECSQSSLDDFSLDGLSPIEDTHLSSLDHYATLSSLLAQRFSTSPDRLPSSTTIHSLIIDSARNVATKLAFSALERDCNSFNFIPGEWGFNTPLRIAIHFDESMTMDDRVRITGNICCSIPLTHVRSFHITQPPSSRDFWRQMMTRLRGLRYITLSKGMMPDLASILSLSNHTAHRDMDMGTQQDEDADRDSDEIQIRVPALEELQLRDIFFSGASRHFKNWRAADAQSLYDALSTRESPPGQLIVTHCHLTGEHDKWFDLVGRWGGGQFRVVECSSQGT